MTLRQLLTHVISIAIFAFLVVAEHPFPNFLPSLTGSEFGLVESMQALLLFIAFIYVGVIFYTTDNMSKKMHVWLFAGLIGCVYVFLEEISYGQHYLNWTTPEYWQGLNDQNETNIHNVSSWFDQKPRLLLEIGVIIGGIIVPWMRSINREFSIMEKFDDFLPDNDLFITAIIAIIPRVYERVIDLIRLDDWHLFVRTSEVQELYFYYFVLLYFIPLHWRLKSKEPKKNNTN